MANEKPCLTCSRVEHPEECEIKSCSEWRNWFIKRWEELRNGKWRDGITAITDTCIKCHYVDKGALVPQPSNWKQKEQTNADRIRAMSDEELADVVANGVGCVRKAPRCMEDDCTPCILGWLKQPAEE